MSDIAAASRGESRRQRCSPSPLLSSFSLPGTLERSRRCLRVVCAAAAGVTLAGGTAIDGAEREGWNTQGTAIESANCSGWNTQWLWTSASAPDIQACLDGGADPNHRDSYGRTPLHRSARENSDPEVIAVLVASGADPHAVDRDSLTPLHYAAWHGPPEVIEALLEAGAAPSAQGKSGSTPLHLAAIDRGVAVIATILKAGADVHVRDAGGKTAQQVAAGENEGDVVLALLQAGANPGAENGAGETHWHKARTNMFPFLIEGTPAWCWLREGEQCPPPEGN